MGFFDKLKKNSQTNEQEKEENTNPKENEFEEKLNAYRNPEIDALNDSIDAVLNSSSARQVLSDTVSFRDKLQREKKERDATNKENNNFSFNYNNESPNEESSYITVYQNSSGNYAIEGSEILKINGDIIFRDNYKYDLFPLDISKLPPEYISVVKDDKREFLEITDDILLTYSLAGYIYREQYDRVMSKFYDSVNNLNPKKSR